MEIFPLVTPLKSPLQAVTDDSKLARNVTQVLIKRNDAQETKKPCNNMQGQKIPQTGVVLDNVTTIPSKDLQQMEKPRCPEKCPNSERYRLVMELCLGLDLYEIEALIGSLQAIAERKIEDALIVR